MKIKTLIVDDEKSARNSLNSFLQQYCTNIDVIGLAENIEEAEKLIELHNPGLVFLDIEMPRGNAFDLLEKIDEIDFEVVFVTAFSQYAVQALNLSAAHYILKPVDIDELILAVSKVSNSILEKKNVNTTSILLENIKALKNQKKKVVVPLMEGFEVIKMEQIIYMEADDNFVHIHLDTKKKLMACRSLKFYEQQLQDCGFLRIHRKYLINTDHVVRFRKGKTGYVILSNGKELELAQSRRKEFLQLFKGE